MLRSRRTELNFLNLSAFLMTPLLVIFLVLLVQKAPVIGQLTDRRIGCGDDFHQIRSAVPRRFQRVKKRNHASLPAFVINQAHFPGANALIYSKSTFSDKTTSAIPCLNSTQCRALSSG